MATVQLALSAACAWYGAVLSPSQPTLQAFLALPETCTAAAGGNTCSGTPFVLEFEATRGSARNGTAPLASDVSVVAAAAGTTAVETAVQCGINTEDGSNAAAATAPLCNSTTNARWQALLQSSGPFGSVWNASVTPYGTPQQLSFTVHYARADTVTVQLRYLLAPQGGCKDTRDDSIVRTAVLTTAAILSAAVVLMLALSWCRRLFVTRRALALIRASAASTLV